MKRAAVFGAVWVALMSSPGPLLGSQPIALEVLQPMDVQNYVWLSRVTYVGYYGDLAGGAISAVRMTCDSNLVQTAPEPRNLNVAADAGLRVRVVLNAGHEPPLFGDTLRVILDATSLDALPRSIVWSDITILSATVQCILVNAARLPAIRHIDLRVEGAPPYPKYGGIFRAIRYRRGPIRREFD